jgi:hypothetical protein
MVWLGLRRIGGVASGAERFCGLVTFEQSFRILQLQHGVFVPVHVIGFHFAASVPNSNHHI